MSTCHRTLRSALALLATACLACGGGDAGGAAAPDATPHVGDLPAGAGAAGDPAGAADPSALARLGEGFLVWESNRTGAWRLFHRRLDGSDLRQLVPDEPGREHCCPHVSPDGRWIAFLSHAAGLLYPEGGKPGRLEVIRPDGSGRRVVAEAARTYYEHRVAVWKDEDELIHIDGDGYTVLRDLAGGEPTRLTKEPRAKAGWLIDPTLSWAVDGTAAFSRYDRERRVVAGRAPVTGCQPYFTSDGRWGYWMAGAGGPLNRIDLTSEDVATVLRRSDPLLPDDLGYMYFPMVSRDGLLLTFAASNDEHAHFGADYEVFVVEIDPRTLEPLDRPLRFTEHPGTDRYPDAWLAPLPLGRHFGEAPLTLALEAPEGGAGWSWGFGDGAAASGAAVEHTWERPGSYRVEARRDGVLAAGRVVVDPARPPRVVEAALDRGGAEIAVRFDEPVDAAGASAELAAGPAIVERRLDADGRTLRLVLAEPLERFGRLELAGVTDRAGRPNRMAAVSLEIEPPVWPSRRDGLVFQWRTGDAPNLVHDPRRGVDRASTLEPAGRARLDRHHAMVLDGGTFQATEEAAGLVRAACQGTNELSVEMVVTPAGPTPRGELASIVHFAGRAQNFRLGQSGRQLVFALRTAARGPEADQRAAVATLTPGETHHVVVTYSPGRLAAWVDGERVTGTSEIQGGFFHFRSWPLVFGGAAGGGADWAGRLEGVAIYDRVLEGEEIAENHRRYAALLARREPVERLVVEAELVAKSELPTMAEITPYRRALVVYEYDLRQALEGTAPERFRVAHWAILDGADQAVGNWREGTGKRLELEPFEEQPQLEAVYLAETLGEEGIPLYYDVGR